MKPNSFSPIVSPPIVHLIKSLLPFGPLLLLWLSLFLLVFFSCVALIIFLVFGGWALSFASMVTALFTFLLITGEIFSLSQFTLGKLSQLLFTELLKFLDFFIFFAGITNFSIFSLFRLTVFFLMSFSALLAFTSAESLSIF
ncbi:hypothetical protein Bhyg_02137 [Pseudolycoriella hygida]|uniref:Uncharacterized protein n=1 Tax=Pseudolycoriella hygida TaxID=35572 RepID=A0A9Q0NAW3_9DIPT|nr:hypothetical protein Bhyg_02137 [Pseudolycoriella hygida]